MAGGRLPTAPALALVPVTLAGCVFGGGMGMSGSCSEVPGGVCSEQMELAGARHPGATEVEVSCGVPVCDRKGGAGTVVVTLRDGSKVTDPFVYAGHAAPVPPPVCVKIAGDLCRSLADEHVDGIPPSKGIVSIKVTCTALPCTDASGVADIESVLSDGITIGSSYGWDGARP